MHRHLCAAIRGNQPTLHPAHQAARPPVCPPRAAGIGERQVAAVMAGMDSSADGFVDYKEFMAKLADEAPPHPRMHSAPTGSCHSMANLPGLSPPLLTPVRSAAQHRRQQQCTSLLMRFPGRHDDGR